MADKLAVLGCLATLLNNMITDTVFVRNKGLGNVAARVSPKFLLFGSTPLF